MIMPSRWCHLNPLLFSGVVLATVACGAGTVNPGGPQDTGLDGLDLTAVTPDTVVPGSQVAITGDSFVEAEWGASVLHLVGTFAGANVDLALPIDFVDYQHMSLAWQGGLAMGFPADSGKFSGQATVEVMSTVDNQNHPSPSLTVTLTIAPDLTPRLDHVDEGVVFVNQPMNVTGDGLLLTSDEGSTVAVVSGCFIPDGKTTCTPITTVELPVTPATVSDRTMGTFAFHPRIAGIQPGQFQGTVKLANHPAGGQPETDSAPQTIDCTLVPPSIFSVTPPAASLGQYVDIAGGGFVGPDSSDPTAVTSVEIVGTFTLEGSTTPANVDLVLIPSFVGGPLVRYVVSEDDALGHAIDLRNPGRSLRRHNQADRAMGPDTVTGESIPVDLELAHIKQVVWLRFQDSYVESLRHFGLRAMDSALRARVFLIAKRDYQGVNIEFRPDPPDDFALFSTVDVSGPDVNGLGLFGYDNSPGKDVGNERLYDDIGGVNATTQADGDPGYGGVFVESFFAFSTHANGLAMPIDGEADAIFDQIFDPFRPDVSGGRPVLASDVAAGVATLTSGEPCPAAKGDRQGQIACGVWVLGSMIGTTMTHEVGHSLGLAAPYGDADTYHDPGDQPNRLMDAGGARTLRERAELQGEGPGVFCDDEYTYLQQILPSTEAAPQVDRPGCD